jgi:hypothetical protein
MRMSQTRCLALAFAFALAFGASGPAMAEADEHKRALIRELILLSGGNTAAQQIVELTLAQLSPAYETVVDQVLISETELSNDEKLALRTHLADYERFAATFRKRFQERIDMPELLESVYVPLYDASFSTDELEEIVGFYRTPTGRKVVRVLPRLLQQGMEQTLPSVQPKVMALVGEILAEQRSELFQ